MTPRHPQPTINVTPLVDVVLVLLIIFMVIAPAIANEDRVLLPDADHADPEGEEEPWEVVYTVDGEVLLDREAIDPAALREQLQQRKQRDPSRKVLLLVDGRLGYGRAREAFVLLQGVGFRGVSLKVLERDAKGS